MTETASNTAGRTSLSAAARPPSPIYHQQQYGHHHHHEQQQQHESRFSCNICLDAVMEPVVTQCGHLYCWPCLYRWLEPGMLPGERQSLTGNYLINQNPVDESRRVCPVCKAPCSVPTIVPIYALIEPPAAPTTRSSSANSNNSKKTKGQEKLDGSARPSDGCDGNSKGLDPILSGDEDDNEEELGNATTSAPDNESSSSSVPMAAVGLRQRHQYFTFEDAATEVPARPTVAPPRSSPNQQPPLRTVLVTSLNPAAPNQRAGSLGQGIAVSFQQALMRRVGPDEVPPLHHRPNASESAFNRIQQVDPDATEYLSRILLMLGSFVILCLLLF